MPVIRRALSRPEADASGAGLTRRAVLGLAGVSAAAAVVATSGDKLTWLRPFGVLSVRSGTGPQGVPVNRTAAAAGIGDVTDWALEVVDGASTRRWTLGDLDALTVHEVSLPIACVEGWNAWGVWAGVRLRDLVGDLDGVREVRVGSPDPGGYGRSSVLPPTLAHPDTLLARRLNGEPLDLDHGFPLRLIAPNRPGVLQTKWVNSIEVVR